MNSENRTPPALDDDARFPDIIEREIASVRKSRAEILGGDGRRFSEHSILFICLLVNGIFAFSRHDYIPLFIAASFYLNMFYFVSLLIPTSSSGVALFTPDIFRFVSWLQKMGVVSGTSRMTRLFMNVFFINSRALSSGICLIFSVDLLFSVIAFFTMKVPEFTILIVVLQALAIIVFYALVWKLEPFSTKFVRNVERVKNRMQRERIPAWVITALFFSGFIVSFILFTTTIILLPGITVGMFLSESGLSAIGYLVFLLAILAFSQYFAVRYIHGSSSRILAERLFDYKEQALTGLLGTSRDQAPAGPGPDYRLDSTTILLESKIYQVRRNSLAGRFPVFVVDLDFSVMMDSPTLTAINGYIRERPEP